MKKIVVFTGAGVSADSGVATFRDANGLWANYRVEDVCTPEALRNNRAQVVEFYNMRRKESLSKEPNAGHYAIARMEEWAEVIVITQNVDNLHERAGSKNVLHLHGELMKLRSERNPNLIYDIDGWEQPLDEKAEDGALLRPHIVFFGEDVPMFNPACRIVEDADILVVVGTSLQVYPAAYLVDYAKAGTPIYVVDPGTPDISRIRNEVIHIQERGAIGMPQLEQQLKEQLLKG
ncbi:MAG: NAD-dependent deacylase [Bacteroidales bacterium]|nr:NAD-dependent deacylase [Bacteroidales bacterium]